MSKKLPLSLSNFIIQNKSVSLHMNTSTVRDPALRLYGMPVTPTQLALPLHLPTLFGRTAESRTVHYLSRRLFHLTPRGRNQTPLVKNMTLKSKKKKKNIYIYSIFWIPVVQHRDHNSRPLDRLILSKPSLRSMLIWSYLGPRPLNGFFPSGLPYKTSCAFLITMPAHLILLNLITIIIRVFNVYSYGTNHEAPHYAVFSNHLQLVTS